MSSDLTRLTADPSAALRASLADRYRLERDAHGGASLLGQGGMATACAAGVTQVTLLAMYGRGIGFEQKPSYPRRFSDMSRAAASAATRAPTRGLIRA